MIELNETDKSMLDLYDSEYTCCGSYECKYGYKPNGQLFICGVNYGH